MAGNHAEDIDRHVRGYMIVFGTLLVATILTVAVSYLDVSVPVAVAIALIIASFKASLVALFFMHLISERKLIFYVLGFTGFFFLALLFGPILTALDAVRI